MKLVQEVLGFRYVIPPRDYAFSIVYDVIVTTDKAWYCFKDWHMTAKDNASEKVMTWHCCRQQTLRFRKCLEYFCCWPLRVCLGFSSHWFDAILSWAWCVAIRFFFTDFGTEVCVHRNWIELIELIHMFLQERGDQWRERSYFHIWSIMGCFVPEKNDVKMNVLYSKYFCLFVVTHVTTVMYVNRSPFGLVWIEQNGMKLWFTSIRFRRYYFIVAKMRECELLSENQKLI